MGPKHLKRIGHDPPPRPPSTRPKALEFKACGPLTHPEYNFGAPPHLNPSTSSSSDLFSISGASVDEDTQRTTDGSKCGGNDVVSHAVAEESADVEMQRANGDGGGDSGRGILLYKSQTIPMFMKGGNLLLQKPAHLLMKD